MFEEREPLLKALYRYNMFEEMLYRSNLFDHAQRVAWLVEDLSPLATKHLPGFDPAKATTMALVHDDPEVITGDLPAHIKTQMSTSAAAEHGKKELAAIAILVSRYPKTFLSYNYEDLLLRALRKDSPEAWLVSFADKLDAFCESLHDLLAGNYVLLWSVMYYVRTLSEFDKKFPALAPLLADRSSPLTDTKGQVLPEKFAVEHYTQFGKPHTKESLTLPSEFPIYDHWKKIVQSKGGTAGLGYLINISESRLLQ